MLVNFFVTLQAFITDRIERDEKGATMVEYGLMVALIAVVVAAAAATLGGGIRDLFVGVEGRL